MNDPASSGRFRSSRFKASQSGHLIAMPKDAPLQERIDALEEESEKLALLLEMAQGLSSEKELDALMALIVNHATRIMGCERSSMLLLDREKDELYSLIAQGLDVKELRFSAKTGISGYVAREGVALNIPDAYQDKRFNPDIDKVTGYRTVSILCMPLHDRRGDTLGVIQCLNKKGFLGTPRPFDAKDEVFLSAVASQASIFLENIGLYRKMDKLFEAFVEATSRSIDDRDPCTSGHSRRVTLYALNLARAVHECKVPPFDKIEFTRDRMRQLRFASLLHDAGKIGVREYILCKAQKLQQPDLESIRQRFLALREKSRADCLWTCLSQKLDAEQALSQKHDPFCIELDAALKAVESANSANFMQDAAIKDLEGLLARGWITSEEFKNLSVRRGNLTSEEWVDMRSHVTKSYRMLVEIPWPAELKDLPEVAYTHHEKRDGSGYPRKLKNEEIHFDGQIMCVGDIYDALTASDRPYKKAMPHEKAMQILIKEEAEQGKMLPELVKLFFSAGCFNISADAQTSQIMGDTVVKHK